LREIKIFKRRDDDSKFIMIENKMKLIKIIVTASIAGLLAFSISCASGGGTIIDSENEQFLKAPFAKGDDKETFRVLIMSDKYLVVQTEYQDTIERVKDPGGDKYICDEIKKYDVIDEAKEGMYHISLFPDRGTLMKVRPHKPMNLIELDNLILDDLQRWTFKFPLKTIKPNKMYIKYRIVLRKKLTDEKIFKQVEKKMKGDE
jgi:hypothetical protein